MDSPDKRRPTPPKTPLDWLDQPRPPFVDESRAPPVDRDLLWALVRDELSEAEQRGAYRLIYSFRSWDAAHSEILVAHYHQTQGRDRDAQD